MRYTMYKSKVRAWVYCKQALFPGSSPTFLSHTKSWVEEPRNEAMVGEAGNEAMKSWVGEPGN